MPPDILMPALSPTMEEGKLTKWFVKEGDLVKPGDILAEIETDKATMEFEAVDDGVIEKLLVPEGAEGVKINAPIARLSTGESAPPKRPKPDAPLAAPSPDAKVAPQTTSPPAGKPNDPASRAAKPGNGATAPHTDQRIFASPLAKRIARDRAVDLSQLRGSGPRGRIVKVDVERAAQSGARHPPSVSPQLRLDASPGNGAGKSPAESAAVGFGLAPLPDARLFFAEGEYDAAQNDSMRKAIARRLASAKSLIPHFYLTVDCNIDALMQARARLNDRAPKEGGYKLSVNDFVIKAAAHALMKHPEVNASWTDAAILRHHHADIGVAVDLNPGLITPIVFRAESKGLVEISTEARSLAERARAKKLKPQEFEGGTFAISNLGMFGIREFTAIINPPHSAILAVGAAEERAIAREGKIVAAHVMTVTMGCDHRVIDGAMGARFMQTLKAFLEEPASMLL